MKRNVKLTNLTSSAAPSPWNTRVQRSYLFFQIICKRELSLQHLLKDLHSCENGGAGPRAGSHFPLIPSPVMVFAYLDPEKRCLGSGSQSDSQIRQGSPMVDSSAPRLPGPGSAHRWRRRRGGTCGRSLSVLGQEEG